MSRYTILERVTLTVVLSLISTINTAQASESSNPAISMRINVDDVKAKVSPMLYGLMTEEINYCYEGGLYGELIRNRMFKEPASRRRRRDRQSAEVQSGQPGTGPVFWQLVQTGGGAGSMAMDLTQPMNEAATNSLRLDIQRTGTNQRVGVSNAGFWGIPVWPNTQYRARIDAKSGNDFKGPLTLAIVSNDGNTIYARAQIPRIAPDRYNKYEVILTTGDVDETADTTFQIWVGDTGTVWLGLVSLFPPTYNNRPNGNRIDVMKLMADMKPKFLRFPGGNYLEGQTIETRFDWKKTIGDISERPGHMCDAWGYWSSDGMGLLEFLQWAEDLNMETVMGIYAGYSLRREFVQPGKDLEPYVQDALDEIEYAIGDKSTTWGARRAQDGHPEPFKLTYVEIGNEEFGAQTTGYYERFAQFYDAIKAKYPQLNVIAAVGYTTRELPRIPDVYDDHFYRNSVQMQTDTNHYDNFDRNGPKVFVGEWATREGNPTPNMGAALSDAAWMTGMERNSDVVILAAYAPLFVNVNPGAMQWTTDLIGFDTLSSFGSVSYYGQQMFGANLGNTVVSATIENLPTREVEIRNRPRFGGGGGEQPTTTKRQVQSLFYSVTYDTQTGTIYVKVVNCADTAYPVRIQISGIDYIQPSGHLIQMKASSLEEVNTIAKPKNIVPITTELNGLSSDFTHTFPGYSISVLRIYKGDGSGPPVPVVAGPTIPSSSTGGKFVIRVACGAYEPYTDKNGNLWLPDEVKAPGASLSPLDGMTIERAEEFEVPNVAFPEIFWTERYSMTAYEFNLPNGKYTVRLHFAETFTGITGVGQRVYSFAVQGQKPEKDFDIFKEAGGPYKAIQREYKGVEVTDGKLRITFTPNIENPAINGIEIFAE